MRTDSHDSLPLRLLFLFLVAIAVIGLTVSVASAREVKALVDLNAADQKALEGLKGIGAATAKKIIANRPYKSVDELSKAGISAKKIEELKPFVSAGPAAAAQSPKAEPKPSGKPEAKSAAGKPAPARAELIDLNTADQKALESLPGVGSKTAEEIIRGRPYKSIEDLDRVKGMSRKKIDKLKDMITVSMPKGAKPSAPSGTSATPAAPAAPTPAVPTKAAPVTKTQAGGEKQGAQAKLAAGEKVNINTAGKDKLEVLPGIGPVKAQAIIDGRPYNTPEDIMKVKGIKQGTFDKIRDIITVK